MNGIYKNVGANLKSIALVFFWIQFVFMFVGGIACLFFSEVRTYGIIMIAAAFPAAWVCNATMYAFGDLVHNTKKLADAAEKPEAEPEEVLF